MVVYKFGIEHDDDDYRQYLAIGTKRQDRENAVPVYEFVAARLQATSMLWPNCLVFFLDIDDFEGPLEMTKTEIEIEYSEIPPIQDPTDIRASIPR